MLRARPDGSAIYLRDVARVELGQSGYAFFGEINGRPAVNVALYQASDANALQVGAAVNALLEEVSAGFPAGMSYQINYDTTRYVSTAVTQVLVSLGMAVALVILITYIFLGSLRATLVPAVTIPVSLVSSLAVLFLLDMSINTMTLFALILAIGIVVDDAILVIENCDRHLREDPALAPREAALITMREVSGAIIATTLVLLAVFVPVAALPGITGEMYRQFGVTILRGGGVFLTQCAHPESGALRPAVAPGRAARRRLVPCLPGFFRPRHRWLQSRCGLGAAQAGRGRADFPAVDGRPCPRCAQYSDRAGTR